MTSLEHVSEICYGVCFCKSFTFSLKVAMKESIMEFVFFGLSWSLYLVKL